MPAELLQLLEVYGSFHGRVDHGEVAGTQLSCSAGCAGRTGWYTDQSWDGILTLVLQMPYEKMFRHRKLENPLQNHFQKGLEHRIKTRLQICPPQNIFGNQLLPQMVLLSGSKKIGDSPTGYTPWNWQFAP